MWVLQLAYIFQALRMNFLKHFSLFAKLSANVMINDALTYVINMSPLQCDIQEFLKNKRPNLMSLAILFHFLCAQHVSDNNISIIRSLRLFCWITTLVVLFLVRCVLEIRCGWVGVVSVLQASTVISINAMFFYIRISKDIINLSKSKTYFNIQQSYVLPQCIYVFCVDLRTSSDYFSLQH